MVCDQSGRQRDHHPGSHPEHAVDKNQQHDVLCEQAEKTADAEQRESRVKNQQLVPAHRQLTGQQDERNDQQRRQRGKHLDFEIGRVFENFIQIAQNRRYGQPRQGNHRRNRPDCHQYIQGNRTPSRLYFQHNLRR